MPGPPRCLHTSHGTNGTYTTFPPPPPTGRTGLSLSRNTRCPVLAQPLPGALHSQCRPRSPSCSSLSLAHGISLGSNNSPHPVSCRSHPTSGRMAGSSLHPPPCRGGRRLSPLPQPTEVMSFAGTAGLPASTHSAV